MKTLSLDLRERIVAAYSKGKATRQQIADRFCVSLGMVKKLLQQQRHTGDLRPRHHKSGRKPKLVKAHRLQLAALIKQKADHTLHELREALGVDCSLPAIHYVLADMGLTYKKRRSTRASSPART